MSGIKMDVLVDNGPLHVFTGPGETGYEHELWNYVVAVPGARYALRFDNMEDDARDVVVEIRIDGVCASFRRAPARTEPCTSLLQV